MWNGTALTLNTKPTKSSAIANKKGGCLMSSRVVASTTMPLKFMVPHTP